MMPFGRPPATDPAQAQWKRQLDRFSQTYRVELAALAWGFWQQQQDSDSDAEAILGIDLKPEPHFVSCGRSALEALNQQVNHQLQEILGIIDGAKPEQEVTLIGIGEGQIMLIHFESEPAPPQCFEQVGKDLNTLFDDLEQQLRDEFAS
jgi:hypothetical protein